MERIKEMNGIKGRTRIRNLVKELVRVVAWLMLITRSHQLTIQSTQDIIYTEYIYICVYFQNREDKFIYLHNDKAMLQHTH